MSHPRPDAAPPEPGEIALAGLWSFALQALAGRAAHEINNALNGALVNVAVVQARARPGADAGLVASFAEAAAAQLEETAAMTAALLALSRAPRGNPDAAEIVRHGVALLGPAVAHDRLRLEASGDRACPVAVAPVAARLAVVSALLAVAEAARSDRETAETAGPESAGEPVCLVRCITRSGERPTFEIAPRFGAALAPHVGRALADAGVVATLDADALRLAFLPSAAPY